MIQFIHKQRSEKKKEKFLEGRLTKKIMALKTEIVKVRKNYFHGDIVY